MLGSHFTAVVVPAPAFRSSRLAAAAALSLLGTALVTALVSSSFAGQHVGSQDTSVSLDTTVCEFFVCVHRNACHRCRWKTRKESSMHTDAIYNPQREECNTEHTQKESYMHMHETYNYSTQREECNLQHTRGKLHTRQKEIYLHTETYMLTGAAHSEPGSQAKRSDRAIPGASVLGRCPRHGTLPTAVPGGRVR